MVSKGRLIVNGAHSGKGAVSVKSGAVLAGEGSLSGKVTVSRGGTIHAGDTITSTKSLSLNGGLTIQQGGVVEIPLTTSGNFPRCNKLKVTGTFAVNDAHLVLDVSEATDIPDDRSFTLFDLSAATITGTGFATIEPERPSATQVWDTSELLTTGRIYVRSASETGIHDVRQASSSPCFDLTGRPTEEPQRGIYIQDGKKMIRK